MKKIDRKEHNAAKGVRIATEFDKFKDVLFNRKIIRHNNWLLISDCTFRFRACFEQGVP